MLRKIGENTTNTAPTNSLERPKQMSPFGSIPSYDGGGDVEGDQIAQLHDGEKVLTPDQSRSYEAAQMALAGGGEGQPEGSVPKQDAGGMIDDGGKPVVPDTERLTGARPRVHPQSTPGQMIQQDKEKAAVSGDLVGMGKALLNEKHLAPHFGEAGFDYSKAEKEATQIPAADAAATGAPVPEDNAPPASNLGFHERLKDYDKRILHALDMASRTHDPAYKEQADRLKELKLEDQKANPWGSAENHPGVLGRIGHIAAKVGNIAGSVIAPEQMAAIPGTEMNRAERQSTLGSAIKNDTELRIQQEAEQNKLKIAELGKTPEARNIAWLQTQTNPETHKPFTEGEAFNKTYEDKSADTKEKERYIVGRSEELRSFDPSMTKEQADQKATQDYWTMKQGMKPMSDAEKAVQDYMAAHHLENTPENRDSTRQEMIRRKTDIMSDAALPYKERLAKYQAQLQETNKYLDSVRSDSLDRGKTADEYAFKEEQRHNDMESKIKASEYALDKADENMLAANIVPVLATMTESGEQGIKRLSKQELDRFLPKSSGDAKEWLYANYDKIAHGQIPDQYKSDLKQLLEGLRSEEASHNAENLKAINSTIRQGATAPVASEKTGTATKTEKSKPSELGGELPEAAIKQLRAGHDTTFKNGQVWTLENNKPKRIK